MSHYTPTQRRILALLSDGMPHSKDELRKCLDDDLSDNHNIAMHICFLRRKLNPIGEDIVAQHVGPGGIKYRHMRMLASAYDGMK